MYFWQIYICVTAVWRWRWHSAVCLFTVIAPYWHMRACDTSDFNSPRKQYDSARDGKDSRVSSNLHLPLSLIVSANFAHRPNALLGFPRFGKLAIPILRGTPFEHGDEEKSVTTPFARGVSIFQYNTTHARCFTVEDEVILDNRCAKRRTINIYCVILKYTCMRQQWNTNANYLTHIYKHDNKNKSASSKVIFRKKKYQCIS